MLDVNNLTEHMPVKNEQRSFVQQGDAERDARNWKAAAAAYRLAAKEDPTMDGLFWVNLGHAEKESGSLSAAIPAYEKAASLLPHDADAHYQLAVGLHLQGKYLRAMRAVEKAVALDPELQSARDLMRELFRLIADQDPNTVDIEGGQEMIETARFFELVRGLVDHGSEGYALFTEKPFQAQLKAE